MDVVTCLQKNRLYWAIVLLLLVVSCGNPQGERSVSAGEAPVKKPEIDVMASAAAKQLLHYWDGFSFKSQAVLNKREAAEQKLVDFIALLPAVQDTVAHLAVSNMLTKASTDPRVLDFFLEKYRHYLYDPNSPMRNEGHYEKVLIYLVESDATADEEKIKYRALLELVGKNQVGMVATDFGYLGKDGQYHTMHEGTKPYKMLVFYDPTCTHCAAIMQDLAQTPAVHNCIENGFLDIVSVSLHPDKDSWTAYQKQIADNWINGWDEKGSIINDGLYNIRAYPTIFLLNKDNEVLLKDAPLDVTLRYLVNLVNK